MYTICFDIKKLCVLPNNSGVFLYMMSYYGVLLSAPLPTLKLEDRPLSAVRDCLLIVFAATFHIWRSFRNLRARQAVVTALDPLIMGGIVLPLLNLGAGKGWTYNATPRPL
jgi:hypothetical protein